MTATETPAAGSRGTLCVLDHTGDTRLIWDSRRPDEVAAAKEMFNSLRKKGYLAYKVKASGDPGEAITEFDADAEKIIMSPAARGG